MPNQRTRTGCLTCRGRKLKCDEVKPTCGQCRKSKRQCVLADGPFRHEHNASINSADGGKKRLEKFYKYRQEYDNNHYFLPVKRDLTWCYVTDPYADDSEPSQYPNVEYQQVAANSLAALSNHNNTHAHQIHSSQLSMPFSLPSHQFAQLSSPSRNLNDVESLLNPSPNIDPNLHLVQGEDGYGKDPGQVADEAAFIAALQHASADGLQGTRVEQTN